jgi:tetratricopeptide (TPR) repeat protein/tRNA A-37 threonylcarbamoyl transferase component Bud32
MDRFLVELGQAMVQHTESQLWLAALAVQNQFMSRQQVVSALNRWATNRETPFQKFLIDEGQLSPEDGELLAKLAQRQSERQQKSAESATENTATFELLDTDGGLSAELRQILQSAKLPIEANRSSASEVRSGTVRTGAGRSVAGRANSRQAQPAAGEQTSGVEPGDPEATADMNFSVAETLADANARFVNLRSHAKGGLGEVFRATDTELDREVALKEIQSRFSDNEVARARFEMEACVTGSLEHPGIVPVYSYGRHSDGRPYYAMRFIRGRSMRDEIEDFHQRFVGKTYNQDARLALRGLLKRFIETCNAIAYAHSRGVLHRDIKPANVMLGKFGETLVVDWGLAKSVGRDDHYSHSDESTLMPGSGSIGSATLQGSALGTPGYMSPEQAAGRLDELGPSSDVFSLGATLYAILTGKPPFAARTAQEIINKVIDCDFVPPKTLDGRVPKALEAICLKAMQKLPDARYETPLALASDVERFLADETVSALREPWLDRAARWLRRNRTFTTAAAVLMISSTVMATAAAWLLNAEKDRTEAARVLTAEALEKLEVQQGATQAALEAETAARRQTREVLNVVTDDIIGELLARQVDLADNDRIFFRRMVDQFEQLAAANPTTSEGAQLRAEGLLRIANLQRRLGETDEALVSYQQAVELWEKLSADRPQDGLVKQDLAASVANWAVLLTDLGKDAEAQVKFGRAVDLLQELVEVNSSPPDTVSVSTSNADLSTAVNMPRIRLDLARLYGNQANCLFKLNRPAHAEDSYQLAIQAFEEVDATELGGAAARDYANVLANYASFQARRPGKMDSAERLLTRAVERLTTAGNAGVSGPVLRVDLARAQKNLGVVQVAKQELTQAIGTLRRAVAGLVGLVDDYPGMFAYQQELAMSRFSLARVLTQVGQGVEAESEFNLAASVLEKLVGERPNHVAIARDYATVLDGWGNALRARDLDLALEPLSKARSVRRSLVERNPTALTLKDELFVSENNLANLYRQEKKFDLAIPIYVGLLEELEKVVLPDADPYFDQKIRAVRFGLADCYSQSKLFAEAVPVWSSLATHREDKDWAVFELQRALALIRTGHVVDGLAAADRVAQQPDNPAVIWFDIACCHAVAAESLADPEPSAIDRQVDEAMKYLAKAAEAGFFAEAKNRAHVREDNDLQILKSRPAFLEFCRAQGIEL